MERGVGTPVEEERDKHLATRAFGRRNVYGSLCGRKQHPGDDLRPVLAYGGGTEMRCHKDAKEGGLAHAHRRPHERAHRPRNSARLADDCWEGRSAKEDGPPGQRSTKVPWPPLDLTPKRGRPRPFQ